MTRRWTFSGLRRGTAPPEVTAAISAALQAYLACDQAPAAAAPVIPWGLAGRREAVGHPPAVTPADIIERS